MYLIPKNVGGRFEFFEGFGFKELFYVSIGALLGVGIAYLQGLIIPNMLFQTIPVFATIYITFLLVRVDGRLGKSFLDSIRDARHYRSKPTKYYYVYGEGRK